MAKFSENNEKSFLYLFNVQIMQKILFYYDFLKAVQLIEVHCYLKDMSNIPIKMFGSIKFFTPPSPFVIKWYFVFFIFHGIVLGNTNIGENYTTY